MRETDRSTRGGLSPGIGGHDHDHVAEICLAPVVIGQRTVVHHLQKQVEDFRVSLFDFIEQQHAMRLTSDGFGQKTALIETDVARRRADQTGNGMPLHVLGHVETNQLDTQRLGQLASGFGLADTGRACEQKRTDRLVRRLEACTRKLDRRRQRVNGCILTKHGELQIALQVTQQLLVRTVDVFWRNTRDLGDDVFDLRHINALDALLDRLQTLVGTGFINNIDRLVGHMTVIDVTRRKLSCGAQRFVTVLDAVMLLETAFQATKDADGVFDRRLGHIDFLEATRQGAVFFENPAKLLKGRGADATNLARRQQRFEQVGGIHHPA
ncbi:hypothetical protein ALP66_05747 [Pseudomonas amygdali pv. photiniae]|uniref:Uncharacterized protein n=1 Tax=Pseudomonas amygdali pv. photiniae TaxID=251724 RepID=A0A658KHD2_PSEA0|nr:hypothetical protein ALP66_05747 [Pseudomonas amygdali pv. photiniae]